LLYKKSGKLFDKLFAHFYELNEFDTIEYNSNQSNRARDFNQHIIDLEYLNIDTKYLLSVYREAVGSSNVLLMYEIYYYFVKLTYINGQPILDDFFKQLNDYELEQIYTLVPGFKNSHLLRLFLIFHFNYYRYTKEGFVSPLYNEMSTGVFKKFISITKSLLDDSKEGSEDYEKRDCIMYLINIFNEMITRDCNDTGLTLADDNDNRRKHNSIIYNLCLEMVSSRITFLKLTDIYIMDSQIIGAIFRIFRKAIQILTNESIELDQSQCVPLDYAKELRVN
jgi:hypothetical protein